MQQIMIMQSLIGMGILDCRTNIYIYHLPMNIQNIVQNELGSNLRKPKESDIHVVSLLKTT